MTDAKQMARTALVALIAEFKELDRAALTAEESEATARSWVEKLLAVFGELLLFRHELSPGLFVDGPCRRELR